ncbi:MAG: ABC transporter permease subunit [Ruminococcaceae bacterium]|nr:ABC transporter permease subunit [Oscillospiraceae bacterium]
MKRSTTWAKKILKGFIVAVFWVAVWEIAALAVNKEVLVADPFTVVKRLLDLGATSDFWISTGTSVLRILFGFILAVLAGTLMACLTSRLETVNALFSPLTAVIKATPVASFIILALVWIDKGNIPSFTSFLMVFPIVWGNVHQGIKQVNKGLKEVAKVYEMPLSKRISKLYIPSVLPFFSSALLTGLGLGWKAGIAAEVLCTPKNSIGEQLYSAKIYLETTDVFAWTLVVIVLSFIIEKLLAYIIRKVVAVRGHRT